MSVSGEGVALRSARNGCCSCAHKYRTEVRERNRLRLVDKAAGYLGRSQRRHGMAYLWPPSIAAFGRSRLSAAVDRGSRPSAAAADREIENRCNADPYRVNSGIE